MNIFNVGKAWESRSVTPIKFVVIAVELFVICVLLAEVRPVGTWVGPPFLPTAGSIHPRAIRIYCVYYLPFFPVIN